MSVLDSIKGIFIDSPADKETKANLNTPEQQKIVDVVMGDFPAFREGRQDIEDTWRTEDRMYEGGKRQWEGLRSEATMKNRPNSSDNIAFSQVESIVSALTGWTPEGKFLATEDGDEPKAQELAKFMPWELRQIKFKAKYTKAVRRFVNHGLFLLKQVHDPTVEGGRGQNRWNGQNDVIPLDFGSFFPDPRIGDLLYIQKSKAMILKYVHDIEYFPERYGEQGKKVQPDDSSNDIKIFEEDRTPTENTFNTTSAGGDRVRNRQQQAGEYEYWYKGKPKMMTDKDKTAFKELAELKLSEGKDPSEALAKSEGKMKGVHCIYVSTTGVFLDHKSYVYDHGQYPVTVRCLFTVEGSIWPKGYMRDLISPQIMLNKFSELAVEQTAKMGNGAIIYEEGAIAESKIPIWKQIRSQVGAMLPVLRKEGIEELEGKGPPPMIMNFIQHWLTVLQKIPRRFDNANGGTSFQGESGKHAEQLQSAAQGNLSTATELIEDGLAESFEQLIELVAQFYPTERIGRVLGKKFNMSRETLISTTPVDYETAVPDPITGEMVPEVIQVQEEYVPKFDISVSIGVERPTDREYWVNLAFTLYKTPDPLTGMPLIDVQAVQYTIENGRMEPFEVIEDRMQKEQQLMQKMNELQMQNEQLTAQVDQMGQALQKSDEAKIQADMQKTQFDQRKHEGQQDLEWAKLQQQGEQNKMSTALQMEKLKQPVGVR